MIEEIKLRGFGRVVAATADGEIDQAALDQAISDLTDQVKEFLEEVKEAFVAETGGAYELDSATTMTLSAPSKRGVSVSMFVQYTITEPGD